MHLCVYVCVCVAAALRQGQEVMFRAEDGYWLCPAYLDKQLRQFLRIPTP